MTTKPLISQEELLGGMRGKSTRQASTLLALIENRTAYLLTQSKQAVAGYAPPQTSTARAQAFLAALAQERSESLQPTIRNLERYAPQWAYLVPDNLAIRAALAHLLGQKYRFTHAVIPGLRAALGLDTPPVQQAYAQAYGQPLTTIYAPTLGLADQLRWRWARLAGWLEDLPPFWTAFSLTLTEMVGASTLALPIALAGVGPIPGIMLIVVLGLANLLTMAGIVEAITRNGNMRYGQSYFGQLVKDYLGQAGSVVLTVALLALIFLVLVAFYTGVATTLAETTGIPAPVWAALLFLAGLYFLRRRSLDATLASALVVGLVNLCIILGLSLLLIPHVRLENLEYVNVPFINGRPFDPAILQLIFGVVLASFFGHTSPANVAKVVLRREPDGRALMWGSVMATAVAIGIYSLWIFAVNGAIAPHLLANTSGTALTLLTPIIGPVVSVLGSIYVVLGMGLTTVFFSLALFNQVQEWLPKAPAVAAAPAAGWSRLWLSSGGRFALGILPVGLIVLLIEWLLFTGQESFTGIFSFIGVVTVPLLGGIFPMLMLYASRRKGDYIPGLTWRFLGHPWLIGLVYMLFLVSVLLHGLVIWTDFWPRVAALAVGLGMAGLTLVFMVRRVFSPQAVIELRDETNAGGQASFNIVAAGHPLTAQIHLSYERDEQHLQAASGEIAAFSRLRSASFLLPVTEAQTLKVWAHQLTREGDAVGLPLRVVVNCGETRQEFNLGQPGGQVMVATPGQPCRVEFFF